jgi:hypothetical protein
MGIRIERFSPFGEIDWDFPSWLAKVNVSESQFTTFVGGTLIACGENG